MRGNPPLVSVVIPAYNHEKFVEKTIRSVLAQTYPNIELLVLDDGSKDHTFSILQSLRSECEKRFARFWLETQPNQGTCITLNRLLSQAKGEYITILASDDELWPQHCAVLTDFLEANPLFVAAVGDCEFIDKQDNKMERAPFPQTGVAPLGTAAVNLPTFGEWLANSRPDVNFSSTEFGSYASLLRGNYMPNGLVFRLSVLPKNQPFFTPKAPLEDCFLYLQLAKQGAFHYLPQTLFRYRIHSANTISSRRTMWRITFFTHFYELYHQLTGPDTPSRKIAFEFTFPRPWTVLGRWLTHPPLGTFRRILLRLWIAGKVIILFTGKRFWKSDERWARKKAHNKTGAAKFR